MKVLCWVGPLVFSASLATSSALAQTSATEIDCSDGIDNDGDGMTDCADADCYDDPACQPDGKPENTDARCSDWIDNDGNGHTDCDDDNCNGPGVSVCKGSWDLGATESGAGEAPGRLNLLSSGSAAADMLEQMGNLYGENTNELCSDGIDNDGDGLTDCEDPGCLFDPNVQVCRDAPGMRFSVVSQLTQSYDINQQIHDTRFTALQLRALGPIPLIQDSFFLLSMRAERTPRLTFAMFEVPLGGGHRLNINSGGGGLSTALVRSVQKQLFIDAPFYLFSAFEQNNGAAIEVHGPMDSAGVFKYRAFVAGGSGRSAGNVGGRFFTFDNTNYTYSVGGQLGIDLIGFTSRWDNPILFVPVRTALGLYIGGRYDQRAQERFPALNLRGVFRTGNFYMEAETYIKRELEFGSWQVAYNVGAGYLLIPKYLYLTADFGQFLPGELDNPPPVFETDLLRQRRETMWRVGAHVFFYRNIGRLTAVYSDGTVEARAPGAPDIRNQIFKIVGTYSF